jgi:hypothetical protein
MDRKGAEIAVVRDHNSILGHSYPKERHISGALPSALDDVEHIKSNSAQVRNDIGIDVFIGQEAEVPQLQAETSDVNKTSLRTAAAA